MTDIQTKMKVECTDGTCGKSTHLIVDPDGGKLTHFVVNGKKITDMPDRPDRLVPVEKVISADGGVIRLDCTIEEVAAMRPFTAIHIVQKGIPDYADSVMPGGMQVSEPLPPTPKDSWTVKHEDAYVPAGEVALSQDMVVQTKTDGKVGRVDGLVVDPESREVTHLLMRKGHLWGARDVVVPVSVIDNADEENVYLKIDKEAIRKLPSVKL
jgi:sporulation protein YlmC with PRC-barrel domain